MCVLCGDPSILEIRTLSYTHLQSKNDLLCISTWRAKLSESFRNLPFADEF